MFDVWLFSTFLHFVLFQSKVANYWALFAEKYLTKLLAKHLKRGKTAIACHAVVCCVYMVISLLESSLCGNNQRILHSNAGYFVCYVKFEQWIKHERVQFAFSCQSCRVKTPECICGHVERRSRFIWPERRRTGCGVTFGDPATTHALLWASGEPYKTLASIVGPSQRYPVAARLSAPSLTACLLYLQGRPVQSCLPAFLSWRTTPPAPWHANTHNSSRLAADPSLARRAQCHACMHACTHTHAYTPGGKMLVTW